MRKYSGLARGEQPLGPRLIGRCRSVNQEHCPRRERAAPRQAAEEGVAANDQ